jgi:TatD DNase family protein
VETDAPYLAPVPRRGQPNQPAYLPLVAQRLAELRSMELPELAEITTRNYYRLFGGAPC